MGRGAKMFLASQTPAQAAPTPAAPTQTNLILLLKKNLNLKRMN